MEKPKKGRPKSPDTVPTVTFAMRLDTRIKYLAELAARKHRRNVGNFIEWSIERALRETMLGDDKSVWQVGVALWHSDPIERFLRLAAYYPDLLTFEEAELLAALEKFALFSRTRPKGALWDTASVRDLWDRIQAYVRGELDIYQLNDIVVEYKEKKEKQLAKTPLHVVHDGTPLIQQGKKS